MIAITHANVFDGLNDSYRENVSVVIEDDHVLEITEEDISEGNFERVIDAGGKTVIPGLVDSHVHLMFGDGRLDELTVHGVRNARNFLYAGFTTVRDAGGAVYGIKKGIDDGIIEGPRIFPSYSFISQTCGHGDFRESRGAARIADHIYTSPNLMNGQSYIADGVPEVLKAVREQLFMGASQIKIMAGGGLSSQYDPVQTQQYTLEEMKAAVSAASDYGTYVMAHLYTTESIKRALKAGVKSFEHAHLLDDEAARIAQAQDVFIVPCPNFKQSPKKTDKPDEAGGEKKSASGNLYKDIARKALFAGVEIQAELINKYDLNIAYGTDFIERFSKGIVRTDDLVSYAERFGNYRALRSATGDAGRLSAFTTYQNPYPEGKIGVLEGGAFADLLIVDGDPLKDISVLTDPENIRLIMKGGKIYKDI